MADGPFRYKLLPAGAFGAPPIVVPDEAHRQVDYALTVLERDLDLCHGVRVRWFDVAGPQDRAGDPGVFASHHPLRGCVDPAAPTEARLNVVLAHGPPAQLIRTTVHEALHCEELRRGLERRLGHEGLERLAEEVTGLVCTGVA